ncbi:MAG: phosphocholine cytidylyltransferase family protein [Chloroflexi bacterium]|nr:phosphocholine cytidylyltransferase family protein [Chloroflexota bacterium]
MQVVILAAGRGRRMLDAAGDRPKCLVEVAPGVSILDRQIETLGAFPAVTSVHIVVGHGADLVEARLAAIRTRLPLSTVLNPDYATTNALLSLSIGLRHRPPAFVVLNGDTIVGRASIRRLLDARPLDRIVLAYSPRTTFGDDAVRVATRADGSLRAIAKGLAGPEVTGESLGIVRVPASAAASVLDGVEALVREPGGDQAYWYTLVARLADTIGVELVSCRDDDWVEIDDPADLRSARASHLASEEVPPVRVGVD